MTNNGHTLQLSFLKEGSFIKYGRLPDIYLALQFHFHWDTNSKTSGSEHQVNGVAFPLDMHIVHRNVDSGGLAVLGFFFQLSQTTNDEMDEFLDFAKQADEEGIDVNVNLSKFIGITEKRMGNFYRYSGSLTTPPCTEGVIWTIFKTPIKITMDQLRKFWELKGPNGEEFHNYREVRKLNERTVTSTV